MKVYASSIFDQCNNFHLLFKLGINPHVMNSGDWIVGGVFAIAVVFGTALVPIINESQIFKANPEFEAMYTPNIINSTQIESVSILNVGKIQAKNAELVIRSNDEITLKKIECPESISNDFKQGHSFKLEFPRFSTKIFCDLDFESSVEGNIYNIVIFSDNAPGYRHIFTKDVKNDAQNATNIDIISDYVDQLFFGDYQPNPFDLILVATFTYSVVAVSSSYFIIRRRRQNRQRKATNSRLTEIQNTIQELNNERKIIETAIKETNMRTPWIERLDSIENKLNKLSFEKDQLTGIISSDIDLQRDVGKFFTNWGILEQQLQRSVLKDKDPKTKPWFRDVLNMLDDSKLKHEYINDLQRLRVFRNDLAHGVIDPSRKELKNMNVKLEELLGKINELSKTGLTQKEDKESE